MPDPVNDVAEIARGLVDWQIHALRAAKECKGGEYWTPYRVADTSLARGGVLTPLGLALRTHLLSQGTNNDQ